MLQSLSLFFRQTAFCLSVLIVFIYAGAATARPQLAFQSAKQCQQCHQEIYAEWSQSWMAKAYSNPVFQQDFTRWQQFAVEQGDDPLSCLRCHAPAATLSGDVQLTQDVSREGVTCTVCHKVALVRERDAQHYLVMDPRPKSLYGASASAANEVPPSTTAIDAHTIRRSDALADSSLCAGCHLDVLPDGTPLEHTYHEWKNSVFAENGTQCADCHMPAVLNPKTKKTHRSHRFPGGHGESELLNGVASIEWLPSVKDHSTGKSAASLTKSLRIKVSNLRAGHNFPTGGAHPAKLVLRVNIQSAKGEILFHASKVYEFIFKNQQGTEVSGREAVAGWLDKTLKPLEVRVEHFELPVLPEHLSASDVKIKLSLVYELVPVSMANELPKAFYEKYYKPVLIDEAELLYSELF